LAKKLSSPAARSSSKMPMCCGNSSVAFLNCSQAQSKGLSARSAADNRGDQVPAASSNPVPRADELSGP
jgi:hypothetical protein